MINDQIICPNCKKSIPLTQALSQQVQEKYIKFYKQRLEEEKLKIHKELEEQLSKKIKKQMEYEFKDKVNETEELTKQNQKFQEELLGLNKFIRQLKSEKEQDKIELEKTLMKAQDKIREEEKKRIDDENKLRFLEYEKKLQDVSKANEELKRKLEQGSQQMQGEVLELELENILKQEFPFDEIQPVVKGKVGADLVQIVKNSSGRVCGTIVWESKRTKMWSDSWIAKLKEDQRQIKAEVAIIISQVLPKEVKNFGLINDIWISNFDSVVGLAVAVRHTLINISAVKFSMVGKQEKKEILWSYLTGIEFKQRVEAVYDAYNELQGDLEIEKRWFVKKWAKQEKNIRMVIDNILGMHGDLQGIVGNVLSEIKGFKELSDGKEQENEK